MKHLDLLLKVGRALGALTALWGSLSACGSDGGSLDAIALESAPVSEQGDGNEQDAAPLTTEVLNEFSVGEHSFSFLRLGRNETTGEPGSVALIDTHSQQDYLTALRRQHGELTFLEVFYALAPEGQQPHPALVASHGYEAQVLSRTDTGTVKRVDGRGLTVEKDTGTGGCPSGVGLLPPIEPLVYTSKEAFSVVITDSEIFLCAGSPPKIGVGAPTGCAQHSQGKYLVAAACIRNRRGPGSAWFFLNRVRGPLRPLAPGEFVRAQLSPVPNPGPIGRSFAVSMKVAPARSAGGAIYSGVGELP